MRNLGSFLRDAWRLARPYFRSEQKWTAWGLLAVVIGLNLLIVGMGVVFSFWNRVMFNTLQTKDWEAFVQLLFLYRRTEFGIMPGFCEFAALYVVVGVYRVYLTQWLEIRWRNWMTTRFLDEWLADRAYYRISLTIDRAAIGTDNPDQRIAEDLRDFVGNTLSIGLDLLSNVVSLFSYLGILWSLSGALTVFGIEIPGYMVWVALIYSVVGTWLTHLVGRALVPLRFRQQRVEADFRYALVRFRENMEGVALYNGETEEKANLGLRFASVVGNWWAIMRRTKLLNALVVGYSQVAIIFPLVVAAPRYFAGKLELGGLMQTADAFGQVQGAMSWFINSYATLAEWRAIVERLTTFHHAIMMARAASGQGLTTTTGPADTIALRDVTIALPNGVTLLQNADLTFDRNSSVVISGPSGSGKSTLFRVIAGIWPFGSGQVQRTAARTMFLPQRAYIPLGSLRHVVCYPDPPETHTKEQIARALIDAGLPQLIDHLDQDEYWAQRLSGGEQQRVALARVLLAKPDWVFLDEATASLDPEAEDHLYRILKERVPHTTIVSIAHRPSVAAFHDRHLVLERKDDHPGHLVPLPVGTARAAG
ncbi:MAG TPA: ABC transporter ATP-binding protein/permease [Acetobacteraceae bacterium]|jgi:putative ATP-binding cassette transporter|nr:ABC transporter ATP-binding protein/permease [Acetobacteraceae bacterium]